MNTKKNELALVEPIDPSVVAEGKVVAVQYPSKAAFVASENTGLELATKYNHLMRINVDDKKAYQELCDAIKIVSAARTDCQKEEDVIKKPLNAFRALVINTGKLIRENISVLAEDKLKAEKKRIDDIKQERLLEQQRLWTKNLGEVRQIGYYTANDTLEKLQSTLQYVDGYDISRIDLGDYEDEALTEIALIKVRLETAIAQRKESDRLKKLEEDQKAQQLKDAEILEAKRIADKKIIDDANAATAKANKENAALLAKIAEMETAKIEPVLAPAESEPSEQTINTSASNAPHHTRVSQPPQYDPSYDPFGPQIESSPATETVTPESVCEEDMARLNAFIVDINALIEIAPTDFKNNKYTQAVNRVITSLDSAASFLEKQKNAQL